ncbi:MAG: hypothetical protein ACKOCT_14035 [Alphaproteobacteria bacterium]
MNLARRLATLEPVSDLRPTVEWRRRRDLDALVEAGVSAGGDVERRMFEELRLACRKERRSLGRKSAHQCLFGLLKDLSLERPVLHLTTNVDGIGSAIAAGEMGAWWPALLEPARLGDVRAGIMRILEAGTGFAHLPLHGEAALIVSAQGVLRTFFGSPSSLDDEGPWQSTLEVGIGRDVESIEERLELSRFGYHLIRSLLCGEPVGAKDQPLPPADLLVIGYGAASRPGRRRLPFERILTDWLAVAGERRQRLEAVLLESSENVVSRRWFANLGFDVVGHRLGEMPAKLRGLLAP